LQIIDKLFHLSPSPLGPIGIPRPRLSPALPSFGAL
jgi:hypothetical protein